MPSRAFPDTPLNAGHMIARNIGPEHLGKHVTLPTLEALGRCRQGILTFYAHTTTSTTLIIADHQHTVPANATITVTDLQPVTGL